MAREAGKPSPSSFARRGRRVHDKPLFLSGLTFLAIGIVAIGIAARYPLGSAANMGPGYFPILLSVVLCGIGAVSVFRSLARGVDQEVASWPVAPALSVACGVFAFGLTVEHVGLVGASALLLLFVGYGQLRSRPLEYLLLSAALLIFSAILFVELLRLPLPLWP